MPQRPSWRPNDKPDPPKHRRPCAVLKMNTPPKPMLLPALSAALLLSGCGPTAVNSTPPPERFAVVAAPMVPEGEAVCDGKPCLSDRQIGQLLDGLIDALERAN